MITVCTASRQGGIKVFSVASAENIDDLKRKLLETNHKVVHLLSVDPWYGEWSFVKRDLPVNDLEQKHINWVMKVQMSEHASDRYLVCNLME